MTLLGVEYPVILAESRPNRSIPVRTTLRVAGRLKPKLGLSESDVAASDIGDDGE